MTCDDVSLFDIVCILLFMLVKFNKYCTYFLYDAYWSAFASGFK